MIVFYAFGPITLDKFFWGYLILLFYLFQLVFVGHYSFTVLNFDETDMP